MELYATGIVVWQHVLYKATAYFEQAARITKWLARPCALAQEMVITRKTSLQT